MFNARKPQLNFHFTEFIRQIHGKEAESVARALIDMTLSDFCKIWKATTINKQAVLIENVKTEK
jgi:hypothetical protein